MILFNLNCRKRAFFKKDFKLYAWKWQNEKEDFWGKGNWRIEDKLYDLMYIKYY